MPESSNKGGREPRVTDEDLLDVFRSTSDPVLSTVEVADAVHIKHRGTLNRLQALEEDGKLESKQT
jgi:DNA-binding Lrp family transcriptional regulator